MMGGQIDWSALPLISELLGVIDIENFVADLMTIKKFTQEENG